VSSWSRSLRLAGVAMTLMLALTAGLVPQAAADPVYPSAGEVERSRQQARQKAAEVGRIEAQLALASATMRRLDIAAAQAAEAYNGALLELRRAEQAAAAARRAAAGARREVDLANTRKGQLAAASYRMGGAAGGYAALFGADGPQDVMDRASTLEYLGQRQQAVLDRAQASALVARILDRQAGVALTAQRQAADAVRQAKRRAEAAVASQQRLMAEMNATQDRLLAELAAARRTSVALERNRQEGLAEEAARRAAAARARAERSASGSGGYRPGGYSAGTSAGAARAIAYAHSQLGKPYVWAADGPESFDCSGLTMRAWQRGGVALPHYSVAQYEQVKHISRDDLRPGDLIFWSNAPGDPGSIYHVGLYIGGGLMIQAPRTGDVVKISSMYVMGTPDFYGRP
jgi:peptidoglycan DL-endopeptidase CwlO